MSHGWRWALGGACLLAGCEASGPVLWETSRPAPSADAGISSPHGGSAASAGSAATSGPPAETGPWELAFSDEFDQGPGTPGFASRWVMEWTWYSGVWSDNPYNPAVCSCYWSAASVVGVQPDGNTGAGAVALSMNRRPEDSALPYGAGLISAFHSFSQTYGYFEARIRFPAQVGTGGSFSLWARTDLPQWGRVEVAELRGASSRDSEGNTGRVVWMASPYPNAFGDTIVDGAQGSFTSNLPMDADHHVYGVEWSPGLLVWYIDGVERFRTQTGVPDFPLFPLLFVGAGDPLNTIVNGPTDETVFPDWLNVDWVRVWRRVPAP